MGTITRSHTFVAGEKPTDDQWNVDIDQLFTLVNGNLDEGNVDYSSSDGIVTMQQTQTITGTKTFDAATTFNTSILPDSAGAADIGTASAEWGDVYIADDKFVKFGSDQNVLVGYDETTTDSLKFAATEGAGLAITLMADEGDDAGDEWKLNVADGGVITLGNDIASAGSYVTHLTLTPHATVSSSTLALAGALTVAGTAGITGVATVGGLTIGSAVINEAELETIDGVTAGTVAASKAVVVDSNKDIGSFRNVTLTGELDAATGDFSGDVDVDGTLEADAITLGGTALGSLYSPIAGSSSIVTVGTIGTGTWQGTAVASAYLDADTAHLSTTQTFTGDKTFTGTVTVGVDDTGKDVKFFGASAGAYMEWDESADQLRLMGASADATTSTGKLLLATSLTDINANDVLGKIDFQAPHEAGGTDAITIAASIQAIAQGTFSASVNATDLIFYTGHSEAATEKFRFTSQGELGIGGANYGNDGQVLTSTGAGTAPAWETPASSGATLSGSTDNTIATVTGANALQGEANLKFTGSALTCIGTVTVGVDDTGHDVKFFGATAGAFMLYDESADTLEVRGPSADATTSTGKLKLTTALTDINDNDVLGRIDFAAPLEAGGTDAILAGGAIWGEAEATFAADNNSTALVFATNTSAAATERMRLDATGNLLLGGTTTTTNWTNTEAKLYIESAIPGVVLRDTTGSADDWIMVNSNGTLTFANDTDNTQHLMIDDVGRIGVNNNSPVTVDGNTDVIVVGDGNANSDVILFSPSDGNSVIGFTDSGNTTNQGAIQYVHSDNHMSFKTQEAETARIYPNGKLLLNVTSDTYTSSGLVAQQGGSDDQILTLRSSDVNHTRTDITGTDTFFSIKKANALEGAVMMNCMADGGAYGVIVNAVHVTSNTTKGSSAQGSVWLQGAIADSGNGKTNLGADGNLCVIADTHLARFIFDAEGSGHADVEWTTFSDERLKKNIVECPYGLAEVLQLKPKTFDKHSGMIDEDNNVVLEEQSRRMIGFLAQDVKALMPELVKDLPDDKSFYSLNDGKLAAVLVNAIQELNAKLEAN